MTRCPHPVDRLVEHEGQDVCSACGEIVGARQPTLDEPDPADILDARRDRVKAHIATAREHIARAKASPTTRPKETR